MSKRAAEAWDAAATRLIQGYANRGVFRGPLSESRSGSSVHYKLRWHRNREFELVLDRTRKSARAIAILPGIPARSIMYRELKEFLASFQDGSRPAHRSVLRRKLLIKPVNRAGSVSLHLEVRGSDFEYAMDKLLILIHEVYLGFINGPYDHYRVQELGADPDWGH